MASVDPRARRRADVVTSRVVLSRSLSNNEVLEAWRRSMVGKLSEHGIRQYSAAIRDCIAYVRDADGREIPLSAWTRDTVWEYVHYVEANYCRSLSVVNWGLARGVACRERQWAGVKSIEDATRENCTACPLFRVGDTAIGAKLNALNKFFRFLARTGVAETNFVRDIASEHREVCSLIAASGA